MQAHRSCQVLFLLGGSLPGAGDISGVFGVLQRVTPASPTVTGLHSKELVLQLLQAWGWPHSQSTAYGIFQRPPALLDSLGHFLRTSTMASSSRGVQTTTFPSLLQQRTIRPRHCHILHLPHQQASEPCSQAHSASHHLCTCHFWSVATKAQT